jgi:flagellin
MSKINTNVSSLIAQRVLKKNNDSLNTSLQRLSTGLKINSGADDPAGLIASENLRSEKAGITQAIDNAGRASNIIGTAEGGLGEVSSLLTQLQSLVGATANAGGLSAEEVQANQLQVDSILNTVNRIAGATQFEGKKLLNGNYAYQTSNAAVSAFGNVQVNAARLPDSTAVDVVVNVTNSATTGEVTYSGNAASGVGYIAGKDITLQIAGAQGTEQLSFAASTSVSAVATAINNIKTATGVSATVNGTDLKIDSVGFGSSQFVSVTAIGANSDTFSVSGGTSGKATGTDADVTVNGAQATTDGKSVIYRSASLDVEFDMTDGLNQGQSKTFSITGGGATFSLGTKVTETGKAVIGIQDVSTGSLGSDTVGGFLNSLASGGANDLSSGNLVTSQKILDKAIKQVSQLRGRLGAFQKFTIGSTVNSLGVAFENASAAESAIRDTDFSEETANLTRSQILSQAATTVLAQANSAPQAALSLLRG